MKTISQIDSRVIYLSIIIFLVMMLFRSCDIISSNDDQIKQLTSDYKAIKTKTLKDSSSIYSQALYISSSKKLVDSLNKEIKAMKMKDPEVIVKTKIKTVIKTEVQLPVDFIDDTPVIKLPKDFHIKDKWFSIDGTINRLGLLQIDSLATTANLTYAIADTVRKGILNKIAGKKDKVLILKIDNPNMKITGMSNIYIQEEKKWWQTTAAKVGIGFVLGVGMVAAIN
jgi:hypothetical protein